MTKFLLRTLVVVLFMVPSIAAFAQAPSPVSDEILATPQANSRAQAPVTGFPTTNDSFTIEGFVYFPSYPPSYDCVLLRQEGFCDITISKYTQPFSPYNTYYSFYFGVATGVPGQFDGPGHDKPYYQINSEWKHLAVTYDSSTGAKQIFLDGAVLSPHFTSTTTYGTVPPTDVVVGGPSTPSSSLGYYIDELRVSDSVRYTTGFTPPSAPFTTDGNTAALWHFDDGVGSTNFADASANNNELLGFNGASIFADVNEAPTNINLSSSSLLENEPVGTVVGTLSTDDPNAGDTFVYTLVAGAGDMDNASFSVNGSDLQTAETFNYETKSSYSIRVRTTDQGTLWYEEAFAVTVDDVDETPAFVGSVDHPTSSNAVLQWSSVTNHLYTVHYSTNLIDGFSVLQNNVVATPPVNTYTDTVGAVREKYWKVTTEP